MRAYLNIGVVMVLWAILSVTGFMAVLQYDNTPATATSPPARWPTNRLLVMDKTVANLVVAVHPRCPCSHATLKELAELLARRPPGLRTHVLVYKPACAAQGWEQTALWRQAEAIAGVTVATDKDAAVALQFGARNSGHALLYDAEGVLRFSGGITEARGHAGGSTGRRIILGVLTGQEVSVRRTPVFGCALVRPGS